MSREWPCPRCDYRAKWLWRARCYVCWWCEFDFVVVSLDEYREVEPDPAVIRLRLILEDE